MPIIYFHPGDEDQLTNGSGSVVDEDGSYWVGLQKAGAVLALAAASLLSSSTTAAAISVSAQHQDDPVLTATAEELYWQNPTAPIPATLSWPQQFTFDEQTPSLFGQPDEDFWINPVAPVPLSLAWPQQWAFDEQTPSLFPQLDEDFWVNPVAPVSLTFIWPQQSVFDEQFPALFGQPDEDFWANPAAPVPAVLQWPQQSSFDEQFPTLFGQFDEDFWINPVAPQYGWPTPIAFTDDDFVAPSAPADEQYWLNPVNQQWGWPVQLFSDDVVIVPQPVVFQPEEVFWTNPVAPIPATLLWPNPWQFDEQTPALFSQFNEDYWRNPTAPVPGSLLWPQPFLFEQNEVSPAGVSVPIAIEVDLDARLTVTRTAFSVNPQIKTHPMVDSTVKVFVLRYDPYFQVSGVVNLPQVAYIVYVRNSGEGSDISVTYATTLSGTPISCTLSPGGVFMFFNTSTVNGIVSLAFGGTGTCELLVGY